MASVGLSNTFELGSEARRKVDIIWNVTLVCPWNCKNCCVDAVHVTKHRGTINLLSEGLTVLHQLPWEEDAGSAYDQAMAFRQAAGLELTLEEKLRVLDHLEGVHPKIDFSGGDVLAASEN